jgi:hypothetical protein
MFSGPGADVSALLFLLVGGLAGVAACLFVPIPPRRRLPWPPWRTPRDLVGWPTAADELDQLERLIAAIDRLDGFQRAALLDYARAMIAAENRGLPAGYSR